MGLFDSLFGGGGGDSGGGFWGSLFGGGGGGSAEGLAGGIGTSDIARSTGTETIAYPTADTTAGGGAGGGGFWGSLYGGLSDVGNIAKQALPLAQLGTAGMGIYSGIAGQQRGAEQMKMLERQQKQQQAMAAPAAQAGAQLTSAGASAMQGGQLPPGLEAQATKYEDDLRMQYKQYLSSIGQTDSTAAIQMEGYIKEQAAIYRQQLAQSLYGGGLQGISTALGPSAAVSQTAMGIAGGTQGSMAAANESLAKLLAS